MGRSATLDIHHFARAFGTEVEDISSDVRDIIQETDFRYEKLGADEQQKLMMEIHTAIETNGFPRAGRERRKIWEESWKERLLNFKSHHGRLEELVPDFLNTRSVIRLNQEYVRTLDPNFEFNFFNIFRRWLFKKYLCDVPAVYEFGCGSGFNLVSLGELYPQKRLYGLDWSASSIELVDQIAGISGLNVQGRHFDFFLIDPAIRLEPSSGVLTVCALEQVGRDFGGFISFLLKESPAICVHVEPLVELYDENNPVDRLAAGYHRKRGYLEGFLDHLKELESKRRIRIDKIQRLYFGSLYHEGYSYVAWKPLARDRSN